MTEPKKPPVPTIDDLVRMGADEGELVAFEERLVERFGALKGNDLAGLLRRTVVAEFTSAPKGTVPVSLRSILHGHISSESPLGHVLSQPPDPRDIRMASVFEEQLKRSLAYAESRIAPYLAGKDPGPG